MSLSLRYRAAALAAALSAASPAMAGGPATILFPDMCGDPSAWYDYQWAKTKNNAEALFIAVDKNTITLVRPSNAVKKLDDVETAYLAGHGCQQGSLGGLDKDDAAKLLQAKLPSLKNASFSVCYAAKSPDSLIKAVDDKFGNKLERLLGGTKTVALTGNGSTDLGKAEYRDDPTPSDQNAYDTKLDVIEKNWIKAGLLGGNKTPEDMCGDVLANVGAKPQDLLDFFEQKVDPAFKADYLELVKLNKGGDALTECGTASKVACK